MKENPQELSIGFKNGCLSIIGGTEEYQKEIISPQIMSAKQWRQSYLEGKLERSTTHPECWYNPITQSGTNCDFFTTENFLDEHIKELESKRGYIVQCKCGKTFYFREDSKEWLRKKFRYCGEDCGLRDINHKKLYEKLLATSKRKKDSSYDLELVGTVHESLEIIECIDDNYEILDIIKCGNSYRNSIVKVYKLYKCKCHLCGKEQNVKSSDFKIKNDDYGIKAKIGYYSDVYCDCHKISSFQWRTIDILKEHNINYKVEVSFPELVGDKNLLGNRNLLRYDFAIFNTDGSIKCLIECQGQQHYEPVSEFGGKSGFEYQQRYDTLKRDYTKRNNIPLVEIPYTCNTYEKELKFLQTHKII